MKKSIDLTGQKFGKLTVVKKVGKAKNRQSIWMCKCDCGNTKNILYSNLTNKIHPTKSCGCLLKHNTCPSKHNLSKTRIYRIYQHMKKRCYNVKNKDYANYGKRGIKICDEWLEDDYKGLLNFYNWAIKDGYRESLTIDRINNDGNYEPNNCRWVTMNEQNKNKRNNKYLVYNNEKHTITEWAKLLNISYNSMLYRVKNFNDYDLIFSKNKLKKGRKNAKNNK